jgi:hypothetical protein
MTADDPRWRELPLLRELFRQWRRARGAKAAPATRPFSRGWEELLTAAKLQSASERDEARRDAELLSGAKLIELRAPRYRLKDIERVLIPLAAEDRLRRLFGIEAAADLRDAALAVLREWASRPHPGLVAEWARWCGQLIARLESGRSIRPLDWRKPPTLENDLAILHAMTAREWTPGTALRSASAALSLGSKTLETMQPRLERMLSDLVGRPATLEDLGLIGSGELVLVSGPLVFDYDDGCAVDFTRLCGIVGLDEADLARAARITTTAERVLTVENRKTTFRQIAERNTDGGTLVIATSYPTPGVKLLLSKLPADLPHWHFGDTDPYGFDILRSLRELRLRPINPFLMQHRPIADAEPLDNRASLLLERLLASDDLLDCTDALRAMAAASTAGDFEQESYGPPTRDAWPFFE